MTTISKKEFMNLKKSKKQYMGRFEWEKGKEEMMPLYCNLKNK